ncbi:MAG: bifunctional 4-hydroxy-2-oxoglutarate aldolase/2-dehydro-3-deoxy-phosphogluconate aldolase [Gammaproteobacteria bacterium]
MNASAITRIMRTAPVIPVITIEQEASALPLAEALVAGGLPVLEVTLRTPHALAAIRAIKQAFPDAIVGAGTVISRTQFQQALDAGAQFIVSPGFTQELLACAKSTAVPFLPGVNTPSEIMQLLAHGIAAMKFFPAEAAGGIAMLKAIGAPLPQAMFCPTGGITPQNAGDYLALPNVACVGGSWMVTKALVDAQRWDEIRELARAAAALKTNDERERS